MSFTLNPYLKDGRLTLSVKKLHKLGEKGDSQAQILLEIMYKHGEGGVNKNEAESIRWTRKLAERGMPQAQYDLGISYAKGRGVSQDLVEAKEWYQRAAEQGIPAAQSALTAICGPERDSEAARWYRKAAEHDDVSALNWARQEAGQGNTEGQVIVARMHERRGEYAEAFEYFRRAAEQHNAEAQYELGSLYWLDNGEEGTLRSSHRVRQDYKEALKWYMKAAAQGYVDAQLNLGVMYARGYGVPKDQLEAAKWYRLAAEEGNVLAKEFLQELERKDIR